MINKFLLFFCVIFLSLGTKVKCNENLIDNLCIVNENLFLLLDSIIEHEKKCEYYNTKLLFSIYLNTNINNQYSVLVGSIGNKVIKTGREIGGFRHKDHLFIVNGDSIDATLFLKTEEKLYGIFSKSKTGYNSKTKEWFFDVDAMQDDSYSYWYYYYENGRFVFESKSTYCD